MLIVETGKFRSDSSVTWPRAQMSLWMEPSAQLSRFKAQSKWPLPKLTHPSVCAAMHSASSSKHSSLWIVAVSNVGALLSRRKSMLSKKEESANSYGFVDNFLMDMGSCGVRGWYSGRVNFKNQVATMLMPSSQDHQDHTCPRLIASMKEPTSRDCGAFQ